MAETTAASSMPGSESQAPLPPTLPPAADNHNNINNNNNDDDALANNGASTMNTTTATTTATTNDPAQPPLEQNISYAAERIIGNGSFGVVFEAKVVETGEVVAIKKVLQDKRFKNRELQIMRQLVKDPHPNIVALKHCFYSQVRVCVCVCVCV